MYNLLVESAERLCNFDTLAQIKDYKKIKEFLDPKLDVYNYYNYYKIASNKKDIKLLNILKKSNIYMNAINGEGKTVLYTIAANLEYNKISKWFLNNGACISNRLIIYYPIFEAIRGENIELFIYMLNYTDINVKHENGNNILFELCKNKKNTFNIIKYFCGIYSLKHNLKDLMNSTNQYTITLVNYVARKTGNKDIIKYFISKGALTPENSIVSCTYNRYKLKYLHPHKRDPKYIALIEDFNLDFIDFYFYLKCNICDHWNTNPQKWWFYQEIYLLEYPLKTILKACYLCHINNYNHSRDDVLFFCKQIDRTEKINKIQKWIKPKLNLFILDFNVVKIQRWWRGIYYSNKISDKCLICLNDNASLTCKLNCGHFYHNLCLIKWRKNKNNCPICRTEINKKPYLLN